MICCRCGSERVKVGVEATLAEGLEWDCRACGLMMRTMRLGKGGARVSEGRFRYWKGARMSDWFECPEGAAVPWGEEAEA